MFSRFLGFGSDELRGFGMGEFRDFGTGVTCGLF